MKPLTLTLLSALIAPMLSQCASQTQLVHATPLMPNPRNVLVRQALDTVKKYKHLPYKFGSANPKNGGFDCSGAMNFVLKKSGYNPPRTSAQQYIWVRDHGKMNHVPTSAKDLNDASFRHLRPGDLLFWSGTYVPTDGRTVKITHVGMYMGQEADGRHIMACATNGRSYRGKKGNGYGIYDFRLPRKTSKSKFVGYGTPPFDLAR